MVKIEREHCNEDCECITHNEEQLHTATEKNTIVFVKNNMYGLTYARARIY